VGEMRRGLDHNPPRPSVAVRSQKIELALYRSGDLTATTNLFR